MLPARPTLGLLLVGVAAVPGMVQGGSPPAPYITTAIPLRIDSGPGGICVAFDLDSVGVAWWWEPGRRGCHDRSTGPGVFRTPAELHRSARVTVVHLRLAMMGPPLTPDSVRDILIRLQGDTLVSSQAGTSVPIERRNNLKVPPVFAGLDDSPRH